MPNKITLILIVLLVGSLVGNIAMWLHHEGNPVPTNGSSTAQGHQISGNPLSHNGCIRMTPSQAVDKLKADLRQCRYPLAITAGPVKTFEHVEVVQSDSIRFGYVFDFFINHDDTRLFEATIDHDSSAVVDITQMIVPSQASLRNQAQQIFTHWKDLRLTDGKPPPTDLHFDVLPEIHYVRRYGIWAVGVKSNWRGGNWTIEIDNNGDVKDIFCRMP